MHIKRIIPIAESIATTVGIITPMQHIITMATKTTDITEGLLRPKYIQVSE